MNTTTLRECYCTVCNIDYTSATERCPNCKRSWDQVVGNHSFLTVAAETAWLAQQQPVTVEDVITLAIVSEIDAIVEGISGNQLAARVQWGAIKWSGWWHPILNGKIDDDEYLLNAGALQIAEMVAQRSGVKVRY